MSKYKHRINEIICKWLGGYKKRFLRILETHQGIGDATSIYRKFGCVISFEIDRDIYNSVRSRFQDAISLTKVLNEGYNLIEINELYRHETEFPVILPSKPTDSSLGILNLPQNSFDVIDVDPYGSPIQYIPTVFSLLDDESILLVTSGEMHYARYSPRDAMAPYNINANKDLKSTRRFFREDNILVVGASILQHGLHSSILPYPIFIYDYFRGTSGVQRIGFFIRNKTNLSQRIYLRQYCLFDPILQSNILRCSFKKDVPDTVWRFDDDCAEKDIENFITERLNYCAKIS